MRLCLLPWLVIYRLLVLLSWTCEAEGAYVRSEASIEPLGGVISQRGLPLNTQQHHDDEHLKALWDGVDLPTEVMAALGQPTKVLLTKKKSTSVVKWGLLGPFDSGTNLFNMSVRTNFPELEEAEDRHSVWKHSVSGANAITTAWQQDIAPLPLKSMVLVIMVRHPLSLISSWKKAPYNIAPCVDDKQYADMNTACQARMCLTVYCPPGQAGDVHSFTSVADIYNTYLQQYRQLQKDKKFKHVMLVTYEDMVLHPKAVMKKFAHAMDFEVDEKLALINDPAKDHGHAVGRAEALTKLKSRPWLAEMGSAGLQAICPHLSKELISGLKDGIVRPYYDRDCRDHSRDDDDR